MKKIFIFLFALTLVLTSCAKTDDNVKVPDAPEYESDDKLADSLLNPDASKTERGELTFPYGDIDLSEYVKMDKSSYTGLTYKPITYTITDEDIAAEMDIFLDSYTTYTEVTDRAAENGDRVTVAYTGYIDGEAFSGGSSDSDTFIIGAGGYIEGFQEGVIGHKVGETFDVMADFPEDYGVETLDGKTARFEMTLSKIESVNKPEPTDEFLSKNTSFKTREELEKALHDGLVAYYENNTKVTVKNQLFDNIYNSVEILGCPEGEYDAYYEQFVGQYKEYAEMYQMELNALITDVLGVTVDEFYTEAQAYATETVKMEVVFFYIAYAEGLLEDIDWAEYDEYLEFIAEEYRSTPEEFEKTYGEKAVIRSMVWDKVMDYVMSISTPVAE